MKILASVAIVLVALCIGYLSCVRAEPVTGNGMIRAGFNYHVLTQTVDQTGTLRATVVQREQSATFVPTPIQVTFKADVLTQAGRAVRALPDQFTVNSVFWRGGEIYERGSPIAIYVM